jgi:hypothetical protein
MQEGYGKAIALAREGDMDAGLALLREMDPRNYALGYNQIQACITNEYASGKAAANPMVIITDKWIPAIKDIGDSLNVIAAGEMFPRTIILVGEAGIGKTQAAKFILGLAGCRKILLTRDIEGLKHVREYDGFVWDECGVNAVDHKGGRWTREQQIQLVDRGEDASLACRYANVTVTRDKIRVITCNDLSRALNVAGDPAIARRVTVHDFGNTKLYTA